MEALVPEAKTSWEGLSALTLAPQQLPIREQPKRDDSHRLQSTVGSSSWQPPKARLLRGRICEARTTGSGKEAAFCCEAPNESQDSAAKRSELESNDERRGRIKRREKRKKERVRVKGASFCAFGVPCNFLLRSSRRLTSESGIGDS
ncbi:hypothetical protein B296_00034666 [Ensete ventricosum]|uniref:Uncharacterized protein n=1 Tax=Ensete ventricosum TaxID=4639 RepID=A0A426YT65_ENSVE|nr:hypothetical protein B296_00034666 [Ensete ventricosum]